MVGHPIACAGPHYALNMATYTVDGEAITEQEALELPGTKTLVIRYGDGVELEAYRLDGSESWAIQRRVGGVAHRLGVVDREGHFFRARNLPQYSAQEYFSEAARRAL